MSSLSTAPDSFIEAFGQPRTSLGKDYHWALYPGDDPSLHAINVLVNGSAEQAVVWVFDPYDRTGETYRRVLDTIKDHLAAIDSIKGRLRAAHPNGDNSTL